MIIRRNEIIDEMSMNDDDVLIKWQRFKVLMSGKNLRYIKIRVQQLTFEKQDARQVSMNATCDHIWSLGV